MHDHLLGPAPMAPERAVVSPAPSSAESGVLSAPRPLAVRIRPDCTSDSDGSSSWAITVATGTSRRIAVTCSARASRSACASSVQAPGSARTRVPRGPSSPEASVQGPMTWTFTIPVNPSSCSSSRSESSASQRPPAASRDPGSAPARPPASRQPVGVVSAANSPVAELMSEAVRPIMSAPGPRAGSSARCGTSSSPATIRAASRESVPGIDPTPVTWTARGSCESSVGTGSILAPGVGALPVKPAN